MHRKKWVHNNKDGQLSRIGIDEEKRQAGRQACMHAGGGGGQCGRVFGSVVVVAFQIAFRAEIYVNDVFSFFKNHF